MREIEAPFELELNGHTIRISEHELAGKRVFHVNLGEGKAPLVLAVGVNARNEKFWTEIPQGNHPLSQHIGKLIAEHIRKKKET